MLSLRARFMVPGPIVSYPGGAVTSALMASGFSFGEVAALGEVLEAGQAHVAHGVHRMAAAADFVVDMAAGAGPGRAHERQDLPAPDALARLDEGMHVVAVVGLVAESVVQ